MTRSVRVRASSLAELFDCPARWEAKHIHGKYMPSTSKALLGTAIHKSTAVYDQSVLDGSGVTVHEAAGAAVDAIHHPEEDVLWEDQSPQDLENIAVALHGKYCHDIAPQQTYRVVEAQCDALEITDLGIVLTGTTDRIRETEMGLGIVDLKSGKTMVRKNGTIETKGHTFQLGIYELLGEKASGLPITDFAQIVGFNTAKTDAAQRVATAEIAGAREVLLGNDIQPGVLKQAADMIHSGIFHGNPKSMMCGEKYCPVYKTCFYRK